MHDQDDIQFPFPPARYRAVAEERLRQAAEPTQPATFTPQSDAELLCATATYPLESEQKAARRLVPLQPRPRISLATCCVLWLLFCGLVAVVTYLVTR